MLTDTANCPAKVEELASLFDGLPRQDRIDLLLEFARALPDVPAEVKARGNGGLPVHECRTPVSVYVEPDGESARIWVEVGEEAPTIKAVAGVIIEGCQGAPRAEIANLPTDLPLRIVGPEMAGVRRVGLAALVLQVRKGVAALDDGA